LPCREFTKIAESQKKKRPGGRNLAGRSKNQQARSLAAIMVMIVVVVPVSVMAPFARFFQIVPAGLRLTAVLTVPALGIAQPALRIADSLLALSVVIVVAVQRPRGDRSAQKRTDHKRRNECSGFFKHPCLLRLPLHPTLDWKGRERQSQMHESARVQRGGEAIYIAV
jgi:hypothetical protein